MKQRWSDEELVESWTLTNAERQLIDQRSEHGRLGFAVLLKFFQIEGRFPSHRQEIPSVAVGYLAEMLSVPASVWSDFSVDGRSAERGRARIRDFLGFRVATRSDAEQLQDYLIEEVVSDEQEPRHLQAIVLDWCRNRRIEPPTTDRIDRIIATALHTFETALFERINSGLAVSCPASLDALLDTEDPEKTEPEFDLDVSAFSRMKVDVGRVGLASVEREIEKLALIEGLALPDDLFRDISPKILERYRLRAATESVWHMRRHPQTTRNALLAIFCWRRRQEILDGLVDLMIQIIHRVSVRAEKTIKRELVGELERVEGKTSLLFRLAEAALGDPDGVVRDVLFPVVGEGKLQSLVKEYHAKGPRFRQQVHTLIHRSYSHHYRRMLPLILAALRFRSNNSAYRPVIEALEWLRENREDRRNLLVCAEVPIDGVVRPQLQEILIEDGSEGDRINRIDYEIWAQKARSCHTVPNKHSLMHEGYSAGDQYSLQKARFVRSHAASKLIKQ